MQKLKITQDILKHSVLSYFYPAFSKVHFVDVIDFLSHQSISPILGCTIAINQFEGALHHMVAPFPRAFLLLPVASRHCHLELFLSSLRFCRSLKAFGLAESVHSELTLKHHLVT